MHGLNDYGGRTSDFIHIWLSAGNLSLGRFLMTGIRVVAIDLPGHGRSGGR